jgi:hypothetical protein
VEGFATSYGSSGTGETPQAQPRRLTARPAESQILERKSTNCLSFINPPRNRRPKKLDELYKNDHDDDHVEH